LVLLLAPAGQAAVLNLAWDAPTTSADGSPLTDLSGYNVYSAATNPIGSCPPSSTPQFVASSTPGIEVTYQLGGLTLGIEYFVQVTAVDTSGNESACSNQVGGAPVDPEDTIPPSVSLTAPANNATVAGAVTVSATASDNVAVVGVQFRLDGASLGSEDTTAPYSVSWTTTTASNGAHILTAVARDAAGNTATSSGVSVTVDNSVPTVTLTAPSGGATVSGTIPVSATASDNVGVVGVQFQVDGTNVGAEDTGSPYGVSWSTTTVANGAHILTAVARDAAGNTTTSSTVSVTVSNVDSIPPTVTITSPSDGATVSGTITVRATATDDVGVVGVQFQVDSTNFGSEDLTASYDRPLDTTTLANGPHILTAVARDAAGNRTTSPPVTVTVANGDPTPPTVSITAPAGGAAVSGTVTVAATASDNVGVVGVEFRLDGATLGAEDTTSPYSVSWTTTTATNGSHTLTAVARDAAGNTTTSSGVAVTVDNGAPSVAITAPTSGATVSGTVTVSANASDNSGVVGVQFRVDGTNVGAEDTTSPYSLSWSTTTVGDGAHTLTAVARDAAGNTTTSIGVTVTVDNSAPTVAITAPSSGATVSGTVTISASVSDTVGVVGVQFRVDGATLGAEDTTSPYSVSWTTTTATNGSHTLTAVARDAAGNATTSSGVAVTVDNSGPTVTLTAPASGATVSATVTVSATASDSSGVVGVQFQLDGATLGTEDTTNPYSVSWNTTTATNGAHTLTAVARDAAGNTSTSSGVSVTVDNSGPPPVDTIPPSVSLTAPANNATVAGAVTVSATASDNVAVVGVQFRLDGASLGSEDTTAPYSVSWTTTTASNGAHILTAVARDAAGNTATSSGVSVTVDNSVPTVTLTAPSGGATVSGTIPVSATASDNVGVVGVQFQVDGTNVGAEDTGSPYGVSWSTTTVANGAHILTAVARDAAGNTTTSSGVAVTVDNGAPTVTLTAPTGGATVSGTVTVSATASDTGGVVGVQFRLDGATLGAEDTNSPYSVSWATTTATNGAHTLTAVARDAAGNTTTSSGVSVTVDNSIPTVTLTAPSGGATVSSTVPVSATASDNVGVVGVQFQLDGASLGSEDTTAPYSVSWTTTAASNGAHILTAVARDAAGNTTTSSGVAVIVSNTSPTPTPAAAAAGAGCFIATAAYGSSLEPQVVLLRAFRDRYLLTTPPGRAFVRWYYRTSPPLADQVRQSPPLRALVRGLLWPLVGIAWITLHFGVGGVVLVGATVTAGWLRNRRGKARRRSP
jgi:chitodextrinase